MEKVNKLMESYLKERREQESKEHTKPKDNEFYASSAGSCPRKLFLRHKHPEIETDIDTLKVFHMGNMVHDFVQNEILKDAEHEVPVQLEDEGIVVRGRLDSKKDDMVYEIKSTSYIKYSMEEAKREHKMQLILYLHKLGLPRGIVLYVEKNTLKMVEHLIEYDGELYREAINGFQEAHKGIIEDTAPEKHPEFPKHWQCRYCDYKEQCKNVE